MRKASRKCNIIKQIKLNAVAFIQVHKKLLKLYSFATLPTYFIKTTQ